MTPEARPQPNKTLSNNITYFGRRTAGRCESLNRGTVVVQLSGR
jgi:hypothetical protein